MTNVFDEIEAAVADWRHERRQTDELLRRLTRLDARVRRFRRDGFRPAEWESLRQAIATFRTDIRETRESWRASAKFTASGR